MQKSFLKWAGGKARVLDKLLPHLSGTRLIEPFVGSGTVFLNSKIETAILSDINGDLIFLFKNINEDFIQYTKTFFTQDNNTKESFVKLRDKFNNTKDEVEKSALFIYLNRHCFNGLCRYNSSGKFNTPFGSYSTPYFPEKELRSFITKSKTAIFYCESFEKCFERAERGDVIYCDPPYVPLSATSNFTSYTSGGFTFEHQSRLADCAKDASKKGIKVVISNHDTDITRELYSGAEIISFNVSRSISSKTNDRKPAKELIAVFNIT
jgi:DNA adenine methylase